MGLKSKSLTKKLVWLKIGFQINKKHHWFVDEKDLYWIDLYILDTIVRDVLEKYKGKIILWRFHRRSENDKDGHMPSLLLFLNSKDIDKTENYIYNIKLVKELCKSKVLKQVLTWQEEGIDGQSDQRWDIEIANTWPYFAQGFSEMLLKLLDEGKFRRAYNEINLSMLFYRTLDRDITSLWRRWARHTFIHHLFCIFGEKPFEIDKI